MTDETNNKTTKSGEAVGYPADGTVQYRFKEIPVGETYSEGGEIDIGPDEEIVNVEYLNSGSLPGVRVWIRKVDDDWF